MAITIKKQPEDLSASGNRMYFLVHTNQINRTNYKMTAQIHIVESDGSLTQLPLMRLYPNATGDADIDISKIIDNRLKPEFPKLSETGISKLNGFTLKYKVVFTEEGSYVSINSTESDILTAMKGKFPGSQTPVEFIRQNDFLTNFDTFETVADGVHYLVALLLQPGSYRINVDYTYTDNSVKNINLGEITTTKSYEVITVSTGLKQLSVTGVKRYSFWLSGEKTQEKRIVYNVVRITKLHRSVLYLNRVGGIDHMIVSEISDSLKTEKEYYQKDDYSALAVITDYDEIYEVTTGYITRKIASLSKELLLSNIVYTVDNSTLIPINIEKGTFKLYTANDDLQSYSFKFTFADLNHHLISSGSENPLPESITACCPDGIDDYFTIASPNFFNLNTIFPLSDQERIFTINMIPGEGSVFSFSFMASIYLEFFYSGTIYGIICIYQKVTYLYYAESSSINIGKRVNIELSVSNNGTTLVFALKINSISETLTLLNGNFSIPAAGMFLFKSTESVGYGNCKLINFKVDKIEKGLKTGIIHWDFQGSTSTEKLQNKVDGGEAYNLVANNVANIDDIIKTLSI